MLRIKKKYMGFLLTLCAGVLFGTSPDGLEASLASEAEPDAVYGEAEPAGISTEAEPNSVSTEAEARWQTAADGEWHEGSLTNAVAEVYAGGTIELLSDVLLTEGIAVNKAVRIRSCDASAPCTISNRTAESKNSEYVGKIFTVAGGVIFSWSM